MKGKTRMLGVVFALLVLAMPADAIADPLTFTNRAAWEAAVGSFWTLNFDQPDAVFPIGTTAVGPVGVQVIGTANNTTGIGEGLLIGSGDSVFIGFLHNDAPVNVVTSIVFHLPDAVHSWGADFWSTASGDVLMVTVGGSTYDFSSVLPAWPGTGFFGTIESTPFSAIVFTAKTGPSQEPGEYFEMDNLSIPEPSSLLLIGLGIGAIGFKGSRRRA